MTGCLESVTAKDLYYIEESFSDIDELAHPVLRHRLKLNFEAIAERVSADDVIDMIVKEVSSNPKNKKLK